MGARMGYSLVVADVDSGGAVGSEDDERWALSLDWVEVTTVVDPVCCGQLQDLS